MQVKTMNLSKITVAFFSPTGGTKKAALILKEALVHKYPTEVLNLLAPARRARTYSFAEDELLILAVPVYFGRLPWALKDLSFLKGNNTAVLGTVVYGNRAAEDAPRELCDRLKEQGFKPLGYIEAIAEHSQERRLAQNRPDVKDQKDLHQILESFMSDFLADKLLPYEFAETGPYRAYGQVPFVPILKDGAECGSCQLCQRLCPMGIIDDCLHEVTNEKKPLCMGCRACIACCPKKLRYIPPQVLKKIEQAMAKIMEANPERKPNRLFVKKKESAA